MAVRVGLTGGIGSGKSTVLSTLVDFGAAAIDADAISRAATAAGGAAIPRIAQQFGPEFITAEGALDRAKMRERAYAQPEARRELEQIIHPLVGEEIARQVEAALAAGADIVMLDNMSIEQLRECAALCKGRAITEASGGVRLDSVRAIAETGVDWISVGALTHSAPALDIALDFD